MKDEFEVRDLVEYPDPRSDGKRVGWVSEIRGSVVWIMSGGYKMPVGYYASQCKKVEK